MYFSADHLYLTLPQVAVGIYKTWGNYLVPTVQDSGTWWCGERQANLGNLVSLGEEVAVLQNLNLVSFVKQDCSTLKQERLVICGGGGRHFVDQQRSSYRPEFSQMEAVIYISEERI